MAKSRHLGKGAPPPKTPIIGSTQMNRQQQLLMIEEYKMKLEQTRHEQEIRVKCWEIAAKHNPDGAPKVIQIQAEHIFDWVYAPYIQNPEPETAAAN